MSKDVIISYCGVCCSHCGMQTHISTMAEELKRFIHAYKYGEWIGHVTQDFEFENFMKGLNWFANSSCNGCIQGGGMPNCEVRNCCKEKGLTNCYFCESFLRCNKLEYQRQTYGINGNYARIKETGYENWLIEQEEKAKKSFDNIYFLEKRSE